MAKYKVEIVGYPLMQRIFDFCDSDNKQLALDYAAKCKKHPRVSVAVFEYWPDEGWKKI
jgi:hypothetical protein